MNKASGESTEALLAEIAERKMAINGRQRPAVTLSYAQSLDGSIALSPDAAVRLSNPAAEKFTHQLRAMHDAILIGIGTLLSDDPRLTVRLVPGNHPQPVIVDSSLKTPPEAALLNRNPHPSWIAVSHQVNNREKRERLRQKNAEILELPPLANGWVDLEALLQVLWKRGIRSVMVEGGARIMGSFLRHGLVDQLVLTITPFLLGGYRAVQGSESPALVERVRLNNLRHRQIGEDLLVRADVEVR